VRYTGNERPDPIPLHGFRWVVEGRLPFGLHLKELRSAPREMGDLTLSPCINDLGTKASVAVTDSGIVQRKKGAPLAPP
jgi:hypothetical protein